MGETHARARYSGGENHIGNLSNPRSLSPREKLDSLESLLPSQKLSSLNNNPTKEGPRLAFFTHQVRPTLAL